MSTTLPPFDMKVVGKNVELKLRRVPLSFADLWEARQGEDQDGNKLDKFDVSTSVLLAKDTERGQAQIEAIKQAMRTARAAEWGENPPAITPDRLCLQDGEIDDDGVLKPRWEGYAGMMYVSAKRYLKAKKKEEAEAELREKHPVQILGPRKTAKDAQGNPCFPTLKESDDLIYSGAICDVILQIYPYNGAGKGPGGKNLPHRINCSLEAIKFVEHGTRLGGKRVDAQSAFDEEEGEDYETPTQGAPATSDPLGGGSAPQPAADPLG